MKSMLSFVLVSLFVPRPIRATSISPSLTGRSITNPSTRVRALKLRNSARFDQIEPLNSEIPHVLIEPCAISAVESAVVSGAMRVFGACDIGQIVGAASRRFAEHCESRRPEIGHGVHLLHDRVA